VLLALAASLGALACASSFVPLRVSDALTATVGGLRADVKGVWLTDDVPAEGFGDDSALVVELELRNDGTQPASVSATSFACLMEIDAARPSETLSLLPGGGDEGSFPGEVPGERSVLAPMVIPPGERRSYWALFRGYRFPASEVPRRITLRIPGPEGQSLDLDLADPARGKLRWTISPPSGGFTVGFADTSLFSDHLQATVLSTQLSRLTRAWRLLWEVGLATSVLVQTHGVLSSSTSSFVGSGLAGRVSAPLTMWGTTREPREVGFYVGGTALVLLETQVPQPADNPATPSVYGVLTAEVGLELDVGAVHLAATPFPLSQVGRALPRWSVRVGYTHWRVAGGGSDGYITGLRLAW
jgi:hypothetical protein